uniref:Uncharacterized protein n=1 Tax=Romanomermis culicivorax TaxID=13658 RepID=A0A915I0K2_ROMCU
MALLNDAEKSQLINDFSIKAAYHSLRHLSLMLQDLSYERQYLVDAIAPPMMNAEYSIQPTLFVYWTWLACLADLLQLALGYLMPAYSPGIYKNVSLTA